MNEYIIYCTETQTKKAFELGAPIESIDEHCATYIQKEHGIHDAPNWRYLLCPTAEQMIGWLEEQGISVFCEPEPYKGNRIWIAKVYNINSPSNFHSYNCLYWKEFNTSKEATLEAIGAALEYLINNKK